MISGLARNSTYFGILLLLLCLLAACGEVHAQAPEATSEIPIERCDLLPIVKVRIDGTDMRFLLDTAATSMLNIKSFSSGHSKEFKSPRGAAQPRPALAKYSFPRFCLAITGSATSGSRPSISVLRLI